MTDENEVVDRPEACVVVRPAVVARTAREGANEVVEVGYEDAVIICADLDELKRDFERTNNPVYAWSALVRSTTQGVQMPEWIMRYLHSAGWDIVKMLDGTEDAREAELVGRALGFGGGKKGDKGKFAEGRKLEKYHALYREVVHELHKGNGTNPSSAFAYVASQCGKDISTVRRAYEHFNKLNSHPSNEGA